jgi:hypothetical protein
MYGGMMAEASGTVNNGEQDTIRRVGDMSIERDCECNGICEKCGYANRKDAMDSLERRNAIAEFKATVNAVFLDFYLRMFLDGRG